MTQPRLGVARPQRIGVVDAVTTRQRRMDQRHRLVPHVRAAGRIPQIDPLVDQVAQLEMLGERGRQHQPRIRHRMLVIEDHIDTVEAVQRSHREDALLNRDDIGVVTVIIPVQRAFFADLPAHTQSASVDPG